MRLTTDEHLELSQILIEQHIKSQSYEDVIDALYRSGEILQRNDFELLVRATYYELDNTAVFLKESLEDILRNDGLFREIENYKKYQSILDSDVELSGGLLKKTLSSPSTLTHSDGSQSNNPDKLPISANYSKRLFMTKISRLIYEI